MDSYVALFELASRRGVLSPAGAEYVVQLIANLPESKGELRQVLQLVIHAGAFTLRELAEINKFLKREDEPKPSSSGEGEF
jgi:hypothetical protein